jgi:magnesium-protoporphyrin O-methyltransferase
MNTYLQTRGRVETYFDRTAAHTWARLTSDAPVGRIRATVRAGRERMRATLLSWLPDDLSGLRLLDAGCGTGALAVEAARRGARVTAIDLSPTLVALARERAQALQGGGSVEFLSGDMLDAGLGSFDFAVAMDSLIHYEPADAVQALAALGARTRLGLLFTFAPANPALAAMHRLGKLFPRSDRSPAIVPVAEAALRRRLGSEAALHGWAVMRSERVASGFYTSQAMQLARAD